MIWNSLRKRTVISEKTSQNAASSIKATSEEMSLLEAVFARGDEHLSALIEAAWSLGCRLDPWTDHFDFDKWKQAMDMTGIDAAAYAVTGISYRRSSAVGQHPYRRNKGISAKGISGSTLRQLYTGLQKKMSCLRPEMPCPGTSG